MSKNRLEAFSDGVLAIIITIAVLGLRPPTGASLSALRPQLPLFLSYILSFVNLGIYWNNHHHMLATVERVTGGMLWANLHLLFWLSLVPFTTALDGRQQLRRRPDGGLRLRAAGGGSRLLHPAAPDHRKPGRATRCWRTPSAATSRASRRR